MFSRRFAIISLFLAVAAMSAQPVGPDDLQKEVKELFELTRYDKAVALLERAGAERPGDIKVTSLLGTAYLCAASGVDGDRKLALAKAAMEKVIEAGGEAVILVSLAKSQGKFTRGPSILTATAGELRIAKEALSFVPGRGAETVGPYAKDDLKECGLNPSYGKDSNAFHIKTGKETLDFRPLHFSKDESNLACSLAEKYLGLKRTK